MRSSIPRRHNRYHSDGREWQDCQPEAVLIPQHFGTPSAEEIRAFTRVVSSNVRVPAACTDEQLQGNIALDTIVFPQGTTGFVLYVPRLLDLRQAY